MTSLFQQIDELIPTLEGWGDADKAKRLAAMVIAMRPNISVEIGVYGGRSFFGLALAHKFLGFGTAIGIDPWSNEAAAEGYEGANKEFWERNPIQEIHDKFINEIHKNSVSNVTQIIRKRSDEVEPPKQIGILHIDGLHTEQAVMDVKRFASFVQPGGFVILDDIDWQNSSDRPVERAASELIKIGFKQLYPLGTGAVFQRR